MNRKSRQPLAEVIDKGENKDETMSIGNRIHNADRKGSVWMIRHFRGVSLDIRYHSAFALLKIPDGIRSVAENSVLTNTVAIHAPVDESFR